MKIGRGVSELWGVKNPSSIDLAHGLYNSLYYRTSRDCNFCNRNTIIIISSRISLRMMVLANYKYRGFAAEVQRFGDCLTLTSSAHKVIINLHQSCMPTCSLIGYNPCRLKGRKRAGRVPSQQNSLSMRKSSSYYFLYNLAAVEIH